MNQELQWVHGQLTNLLHEARAFGADEAERLLSTFVRTTAIAINASDDPANP